MTYQYPEAIGDYLEARDLARKSGDPESLGRICMNLSSLYQQVSDTGSALASAQEGREAAARAGNAPYQAELLLILARLYGALGRVQAADLYREGIEAARRQRDVAQEANGWNLLGELLLLLGDDSGAEPALLESYRLRLLHHLPDIRYSFSSLGALRLAGVLRNEPNPDRAALLKEAGRLTQRALAGSREAQSVLGLWQNLHQLGRIQQAQGLEEDSIQTFAEAAEQATRWWRTLPAAASALTEANAALHHQVFRSFVEAAADFAKRTGDSRLAGEAFMAEELNRALSLRETQALAPVWRAKLPPEYWQTLAQLRAEDARLLSGDEDESRANSLRLKISEMETMVGVGFPLSKNENFRDVASLIHFQHGLEERDLFLSFHLGPRKSYLWAVTRTSLRMYELEPEDLIGRRAREFRDAVRGNGALSKTENPGRLGSELYKSLFGQLSVDEVKRPAWFVTQEGPLFDVPFAALVRRSSSSEGAGRGAGSGLGKSLEQENSEYLVERNSVQVVPGALLLHSAKGPAGSSGRMVAVGDPIYNVADARYAGGRAKSQSLFQFLPWSRHAPAGTAQLSRLVETGAEVGASAAAWQNGTGGDPVLALTGTGATRAHFLEAIQSPTSVIHLATHVLTPQQRPEQAFIAFSLDSTGAPELLATSDIAKLHVPGALVVMSGCATAAGETREGAGLLGLTRAWLMAGASGALATGWPVQDSAGDLLPQFYRYLQNNSAAEALRRSQADMIRAGGWRSSPSYWAAYQLTGGDR